MSARSSARVPSKFQLVVEDRRTWFSLRGSVACGALFWSLGVWAVAPASAVPTDLSSYVLFAEQRVLIGQNGIVVGNVGVNQPTAQGATLGSNATLVGDSDLVAGNVRLGSFSSIDDLFANKLLAS